MHRPAGSGFCHCLVQSVQWRLELRRQPVLRERAEGQGTEEKGIWNVVCLILLILVVQVGTLKPAQLLRTPLNALWKPCSIPC